VYIVDPMRPWAIPSENLALVNYSRTSANRLGRLHARRRLGDGSGWDASIASAVQGAVGVGTSAAVSAMTPAPSIILNPSTGTANVYNPSTGQISTVGSSSAFGLSTTQLLLFGGLLLLGVVLLSGGRK
jgi:hypothetical protein